MPYSKMMQPYQSNQLELILLQLDFSGVIQHQQYDIQQELMFQLTLHL